MEGINASKSSDIFTEERMVDRVNPHSVMVLVPVRRGDVLPILRSLAVDLVIADGPDFRWTLAFTGVGEVETAPDREWVAWRDRLIGDTIRVRIPAITLLRLHLSDLVGCSDRQYCHTRQTRHF